MQQLKQQATKGFTETSYIDQILEEFEAKLETKPKKGLIDKILEMSPAELAINEIMANFDPEEFQPYKPSFDEYKFLKYIKQLMDQSKAFNRDVEYILRLAKGKKFYLADSSLCGCSVCAASSKEDHDFEKRINPILREIALMNLSQDDWNIINSFVESENLNKMDDQNYEYFLKAALSPCGCG